MPSSFAHCSVPTNLVSTNITSSDGHCASLCKGARMQENDLDVVHARCGGVLPVQAVHDPQQLLLLLGVCYVLIPARAAHLLLSQTHACMHADSMKLFLSVEAKSRDGATVSRLSQPCCSKGAPRLLNVVATDAGEGRREGCPGGRRRRRPLRLPAALRRERGHRAARLRRVQPRRQRRPRCRQIAGAVFATASRLWYSHMLRSNGTIKNLGILEACIQAAATLRFSQVADLWMCSQRAGRDPATCHTACCRDPHAAPQEQQVNLELILCTPGI